MFDNEPKSKQELEQQIKDNMDVSTGQRIGNVATGVVGGAAMGVLGVAHVVGSAVVKAQQAASETRIVDNATHFGHATATNKDLYSQALMETGLFNGLKEGATRKEVLEGLKHFAKTNKLALGIVAGVAVATGLFMGLGSARGSRDKNDQKIGEAYRAHEKQFGEAPFHDAAVAEKIANKETIGHHTGQVNSGREAAPGMGHSV